MGKTAAVFLLVLLFSGTTLAMAMVIPVLSPAEFITWGPEQRVVETEFNGPVANVGDWNGDGIKDLLVGVYQAGAVYFYPNTGTNEEPLFMERIQLTADGDPIAVSYG